MVNKHQAVSPVVVVGLVVGFGLHGVVVGAESENSKYSTGAYFDGGATRCPPLNSPNIGQHTRSTICFKHLKDKKCYVLCESTEVRFQREVSEVAHNARLRAPSEGPVDWGRENPFLSPRLVNETD